MKSRRWPFILALAHTVILAFYALPVQLIPVRLHYWSASYTKPLFHQQWNLFAPNVPPCACTLIQSDGHGKTVDLMEGRGLLGRRIVKWGCRSMPNYRSVLPTDSLFEAWPGFWQYTAGLVNDTSCGQVYIKRSCFDGFDNDRNVLLDAPVIQE